MSIITAKSVSHSVALKHHTLSILKDIDLQVATGDSVAIVGASGSGKSTLLGLLAGLDVPSSGSIALDGHDLTQMDEERRAALRARYVAFVFQNFQLLPGLTAIENVLLPLEIHQHDSAQQRALDYLDRVGLSHRLKHYPSQLSGGEQQRVAIARAFACRAPILFADEPTGNLDSETGEKISDILFELNATEKTTLVMVTHDETLAQRCQHQYRMQAGQLSQQI